MSIWKAIKNMSKEEFAKWLYENCDHVSAEYGACSGAYDYTHVLELLDSDIGGDW